MQQFEAWPRRKDWCVKMQEVITFSNPGNLYAFFVRPIFGGFTLRITVDLAYLREQ